MELLTIGVFARAAGLTPKALRLYDETGLLPPAAVDAESGYRLYGRDQVERARLIAQLRRIGMPLAQVRIVCGLEPPAAAVAIDTYWQQVTATTAAHGRIAALLVQQLSERGTTMTGSAPALALCYAARSDIGAVRASNEDTAYAGDRLLAVADGGGGPTGADASRTAIDALKALELTAAPATELLTLSVGAIAEADRAVRSATGDAQPITTLTALLRHGSQLVLVHIGDTRAYLLRAGEFVPLTQDHTWVQTQVDQGKLSRDEAATHPQRALLVRAIGAGEQPVEADLALRTALLGDRYLLCSDGLSAVVDRVALHTALGEATDPGQAVQRMIDLAYAAGAPDNIAVVVADVVTGGA